MVAPGTFITPGDVCHHHLVTVHLVHVLPNRDFRRHVLKGHDLETRPPIQPSMPRAQVCWKSESRPGLCGCRALEGGGGVCLKSMSTPGGLGLAVVRNAALVLNGRPENLVLR